MALVRDSAINKTNQKEETPAQSTLSYLTSSARARQAKNNGDIQQTPPGKCNLWKEMENSPRSQPE